MDLHRIRNTSIIAHIDHGKSTLADRAGKKRMKSIGRVDIPQEAFISALTQE